MTECLKMLKFFGLLIFVLANTACDREVKQTVPAGVISASREEVITWIKEHDYQAVIAYRRINKDEFKEVARVGSRVSDLMRYIDAKSFEIFTYDDEIEGVMAFLSRINDQDGMGVCVEFRSVISGNVTLDAEEDKLVVDASMLIEVLRESHITIQDLR